MRAGGEHRVRRGGRKLARLRRGCVIVPVARVDNRRIKGGRRCDRLRVMAYQSSATRCVAHRTTPIDRTHSKPARSPGNVAVIDQWSPSHQDCQNKLSAFVIDSTPKVHPIAGDPHHHLIQMPSIARTRTMPAQPPRTRGAARAAVAPYPADLESVRRGHPYFIGSVHDWA